MIKIEHQQLLQQLLALLFKYQNAGKGHVFFDIAGHVGNGNVKVYVGEWEYNKEPEISLWLYRKEGIVRAIEEVKELYENTPNIEEVNRKQAILNEEIERERYEQLKAKFEPNEQ